jgi:hypothetical protein
MACRPNEVYWHLEEQTTSIFSAEEPIQQAEDNHGSLSGLFCLPVFLEDRGSKLLVKFYTTIKRHIPDEALLGVATTRTSNVPLNSKYTATSVHVYSAVTSCAEQLDFVDPLRWPRNALYSQKLALSSLTSDGHSVRIVRSRNNDT